MIFVEEMLVEKLLSLKNPAKPLKIAGLEDKPFLLKSSLFFGSKC